ncbi:glutathione S-transferase theta-1 [Latimeria chalumnae]|uniref:glutathione S-transferase theta-1 n=1 Tax=Latimeria chalumnae TaxID=7897 RepID=UPI0006D8E8CF|nr:PREDICTED: glutathione S-transferase theta-1-like [Latimeria chalumnae]|eukprot:XP_014344729.1 PREDICTED: glutathione S-transferase theta-1-like [Latimeria chalumnae]
MGLELYLDLFSQPCRSVYIFAKKNQIPFEFKQVELVKGQQYAEDFGKINSLKKVPALKDGDFTLAESIAILLYLSRRYKTPEHWYPSDVQKRAKVDEYLSWQHTSIRPHGSKIFWYKIMIPSMTGEQVSKEKMKAAIEDLDVSLQQFEEKFLQEKPFIAGEEISLADLVAIVELMQPVAAKHDVFKNRQKLAAWHQRVEAAIGRELFREVHEKLLVPKDLAMTVPDPTVKEAMQLKIKKMMQ